MGSFILSAYSTMAFTAESAPFGSYAIVGMTLRAMSFLGFMRSGKAPASVNRSRHWFQMFRANTVVNATEMVVVQPWWRRTFQEVMGIGQSAIQPKATIALTVIGGEPQHAAIRSARINLRPEALFGSKFDGHRDLLSRGVTRPVVSASRSHCILSREVLT